MNNRRRSYRRLQRELFPLLDLVRAPPPAAHAKEGIYDKWTCVCAWAWALQEQGLLHDMRRVSCATNVRP